MVEAIHLSFSRHLVFLAGCYQIHKFPNICHRRMYIFYKHFIDGFFVFNCILLFFGLYKYIDNTPILSETTSYSLLYCIIYVINRQVRSAKVTNVFLDMEKQEVDLLKAANSDVLKMLTHYATLNNQVTKSIFWIVTVFCSYYVVSRRFLSNKPVYYQYYPLDTERFIILEFITQSVFLAVCDIYFVFSKASLIMMLMFMLFRLKTIQYFLKNIEHFANHVQEKFKMSTDDARYHVIKSIIKEHCLVIE